MPYSEIPHGKKIKHTTESVEVPLVWLQWMSDIVLEGKKAHYTNNPEIVLDSLCALDHAIRVACRQKTS